MRVYSVMPQYQAKSIKRNDQINSSNQITPAAMAVSLPRMSGILLSFTGNEEKNIYQFASYCSENKRYGYMAGGLGVVAQEAPSNWRLHEGADVRDFSPYHSYDNLDGGIKAVIVKKNAKGEYITSYPADSFYHAKANESLEALQKRENIQLKEGEQLAFVRQEKPDDKGFSKVIILEDTGIKGTVNRASVDSILQTENIPYRLFRSVSTPDTVDEAVDKYKQRLLKDIQKPFREQYDAELHEQYKDELEHARQKDLAATALVEKENVKKRELRPNIPYETVEFKTERKKVEAKIKEEIEKKIKANTEIGDKYKALLETTDVKKQIEAIKSKAAPEVAERNAVYFIHTPGLARFEAPYGNDNAYYSTTAKIKIDGKLQEISTNLSYADSNRAFVDILPQLNTKEHGFYNPANIWLHDRPGFMVMSYIADESHFGNKYWNGVKADGRFHNPGRDYQGAESNPFEFFRMVARKEDIDKLNNHPQIEQLREIEEKYAKKWQEIGAVPVEDRRSVYEIMDPFLSQFADDFADTVAVEKTYNISMVPVAGTKLNPQNISCGTVSVNYGKEMASLDTPDIAQFMTTKLASIRTLDITNGSTPANLRLDDPDANFCRGNLINGITQAKDGFTTYKYKPVFENGKFVSDNIDEIINAKKANTKWLLDILGDAYNNSGPNGINQMFFSKQQISDKATVIGHLSKYKEGDMLFMGWGRPDPQKGYPSTFQAFLDFLKDPNVDKEIKKHAKVIVGAGVWNDGARDYNWVKNIISEIESLDGGIYKGNACYVNGFFPNRLVGCATYSIFTSRFEPCGITPLESFAAGTPVISTRTGGAPDFISAARGYLTEHPYLRNPEDLNLAPSVLAGKNGSEYGHTLDAERMKANAAEVKDCVGSAISDYNLKPEEGKLSKYTEMVRDCLQQKIDWHENSAYNGGKTANERYMTEVFETGKGFSKRNKNPLRRLVGDKFGVASRYFESAQKIRSKWTKAIIGTGIAVAAFGTAAYAYIQRKHKTPAVTPKQINKVA